MEQWIEHTKHSDAQSYLSINRLNLLKGGKNKHSSFAHTRFGLTKDVHAQNGLWDAFMLNCTKKVKSLRTLNADGGQTYASKSWLNHRSLTFRWMLKAAVDDGP